MKTRDKENRTNHVFNNSQQDAVSHIALLTLHLTSYECNILRFCSASILFIIELTNCIIKLMRSRT